MDLQRCELCYVLLYLGVARCEFVVLELVRGLLYQSW